MENKVKMARVKAGMTQKELSEKASVARAIISGIESGRVTTTTTDTLQKIANALGVKVSDIFF